MASCQHFGGTAIAQNS